MQENGRPNRNLNLGVLRVAPRFDLHHCTAFPRSRDIRLFSRPPPTPRRRRCRKTCILGLILGSCSAPPWHTHATHVASADSYLTGSPAGTLGARNAGGCRVFLSLGPLRMRRMHGCGRRATRLCSQSVHVATAEHLADEPTPRHCAGDGCSAQKPQEAEAVVARCAPGLPSTGRAGNQGHERSQQGFRASSRLELPGLAMPH